MPDRDQLRALGAALGEGDRDIGPGVRGIWLDQCDVDGAPQAEKKEENSCILTTMFFCGIYFFCAFNIFPVLCISSREG